ncbi:DUF3159 domain-containing protein [Angustibacter sp. McL0619]|uniref:DUF3159 domain-containing protein n=1 Tax=Angustibacter sp. McL0619 TaxID=3415676 RepID=UPI003CE83F95
MSLVLGHVPEGATTVEEVVRHRLVEGVGGLRGSVEAALPTVAFVAVWTSSKNLTAALVASAAIVLVSLTVRLVQRQTLRYALGSLAAVAIAAFFALRSGRAQDVFLPGILYSCTMLVVTLLSVVTRWPMVGFIVGAAHPEDPLAWRTHHGIVRLCQRLTLVLAAMYAIRVAVMLPTYFAGLVGWLGVEKIVLGWPLYLAAIAVMGAVLLRGHTPLDPEDLEPAAEPEGNHSIED